MTPKRVIPKRPSRALRVWPSSRKSSSSKLLRVGSARALNTASTSARIGDLLVTCQPGSSGGQAAAAPTGVPLGEVSGLRSPGLGDGDATGDPGRDPRVLVDVATGRRHQQY